MVSKTRRETARRALTTVNAAVQQIGNCPIDGADWRSVKGRLGGRTDPRSGLNDGLFDPSKELVLAGDDHVDRRVDTYCFLSGRIGLRGTA
jgi:hypothetical protein